jgi:histidine triad (HIT) family protein
MTDSIFTRIIRREIPGEIVHEDEHCIVLSDIHPVAPTHLLIIPKKQIPRIAEASENDAALLGHLLIQAKLAAQRAGLKNGFRIVINNGPDAGESVPHLHVHVIGGRTMDWPPG